MTKSNNANSPANRVVIAALLLILIIAAWLRFMRLDEPIGGYHSMNEAWHIITARNFEHGSFLHPRAVESDVDVKIRALYVYAVYAGFHIFGEKPGVARAVSAVSGVLAVLLLFCIGARMRNAATGLAAAAFLAVSPIHTVLSRNAQPDAMAVALTLATVWLWLVAENKQSKTLMVVSGLCWGAAVFTKNFAVLLLPAIVFHEAANRGARAAFKNVLLFCIPALAVPAPFLVFHVATNAAGVIAIYRQIVLQTPHVPEMKYMAQEMMWALSPVVFALAAAGIVIAPFTRLKNSALVWSAALVFLFQYFFQHVHSYYFLSATPFLVVIAALGVESLPRILRGAFLALAIIASLAQTTLSIAAMQYHFDRFRNAAEIIERQSATGTVIAPRLIINNYGPVLHYYMPRHTILTQEDVPVDPDTGRLRPRAPRPYVFLSPVALPEQARGLNPNFQTSVTQELYGVCIGSRVLYMLPRNLHSFIPHNVDAAPPLDRASCSGFAPFAAKAALIIHRVPDNVDVVFQKDNNGGASYRFEYRRSQPAPADQDKK